MAATVVSQAFTDLFEGLSSQVADLKGLSMLRNSGAGDQWCDRLGAMDRALSTVENKMIALREQVDREKASVDEAKV